MPTKNGVDYYTTGYLPIPFPEDNVDCAHCPECFLQKDELGRWKCNNTGELIFFPRGQRGRSCKIKFKGD